MPKQQIITIINVTQCTASMSLWASFNDAATTAALLLVAPDTLPLSLSAAAAAVLRRVLARQGS